VVDAAFTACFPRESVDFVALNFRGPTLNEDGFFCAEVTVFDPLEAAAALEDAVAFMYREGTTRPGEEVRLGWQI